MINNVVLIGRLTADPELKTTAQGTSFCRFSIAVDRDFARQGEERQTDFINIVTWSKSAEFVAKYFNKGKLIGIQGSIQTGKYTDKDGNSRTSFDVRANQISFVGAKGDNAASSAPATENTFDIGNMNDFSKVPEDDSELPF